MACDDPHIRLGLTLHLGIHLRAEQHGQDRQIRPQKKQRNRAQRSQQRIKLAEPRRAVREKQGTGTPDDDTGHRSRTNPAPLAVVATGHIGTVPIMRASASPS